MNGTWHDRAVENLGSWVDATCRREIMSLLAEWRDAPNPN